MNIKSFFQTSKKSSGCALELKSAIENFLKSEKTELVILANNESAKKLNSDIQKEKHDKLAIVSLTSDKIQIGTFYNALQDVVKKEAYEKMKAEKKFGSFAGNLEKNEKSAVYLSK